MKKSIALLLALVLCLSLCACAVQVPQNGGGDTETKPSATPTQTSHQKDNKIGYISDRRVQYNKQNDQYIVFFGLQTEAKEYTSSAGTAEIVIKDDGGEILYEKNLYFTKNDFTSWTNTSWDSSRYLCGLYINRSDLQGAASSSGKLSLKVVLDDGTWFEAEQLYITDLPAISVNIILPEIPSTYIDTRYSSYTATVQVSKLEYNTTINYDGTATLKVNVVLKLLSKSNKVNESSTVCVGYKLYDSDGLVVDSGHIYSNPIAVGEASKEDFIIWDLNPRETYKLVFSNAS